MRGLIKVAGTGFKASTAAALRAHLKACMTPSLEAEAVKRAPQKKYQLLAPPGWTWEQFQFFRADYRFMLDSLHHWMFNGYAHPRAEERFKAMV